MPSTTKQKQRHTIPHPSEESKIPCKTDLRALAAVAAMHMIKPNRWKLGSPCGHVRKMKNNHQKAD